MCSIYLPNIKILELHNVLIFISGRELDNKFDRANLVLLTGKWKQTPNRIGAEKQFSPGPVPMKRASA